MLRCSDAYRLRTCIPNSRQKFRLASSSIRPRNSLTHAATVAAATSPSRFVRNAIVWLSTCVVGITSRCRRSALLIILIFCIIFEFIVSTVSCASIVSILADRRFISYLSKHFLIRIFAGIKRDRIGICLNMGMR